jgi:hypothetical protein
MLSSVGVDAKRIYLRADAHDYFHVAVAYRVGGRSRPGPPVSTTTAVLKSSAAAQRPQALEHLTTATTMYREMDMLDQAEAETRGLAESHRARRHPRPQHTQDRATQEARLSWGANERQTIRRR